MSGEIVVIPLACAPIEECSGLFLGTLAFPSDPKKARQFRDAYWRLALQLTAHEDPAFADTLYPLAPRLLLMRHGEAENVLREGERALFRRKQAFFAEQVRFAEARLGINVSHLDGFGDRMANTATDRYIKTNIWLRKKAGASTKPLIRDAMTPSKPVIHVAAALWTSVSCLIEKNIASDEEQAHMILFSDKETLALLIHSAETFRALAIKAGIADESGLTRFVAF